MQHVETSTDNKFYQGSKITMARPQNETVRVTLKWKPQGKRPRIKPRKRRIDMVEEDIKIQGVEEWREVVKVDRRRNVVRAAKRISHARKR